MKKTMMFATGGLVFTLGIGACNGPAAPTVSGPTVEADRSALNTQIQRDLSRLNELQIITSGQLLVDLPDEATSCYGLPCPGSSWVKPYWDERARQADRLQKLADLAPPTVAYISRGEHTKSETDAALAALAGLRLVDGASLIEAQPAVNSNCYNLACPSDVAAADDATALHVAQVFAIVDAAKRSGL